MRASNMGGQEGGGGVTRVVKTHHTCVIQFLRLPHGQECIARSFGKLNNGRGCGQPGPDRRETTRKFWQGSLQGRVLAVEGGHRGNHRRALQASVREWCGYGHTRKQDVSVVTEPYTIATLFGISFTWNQERDASSSCPSFTKMHARIDLVH